MHLSSSMVEILKRLKHPFKGLIFGKATNSVATSKEEVNTDVDLVLQKMDIKWIDSLREYHFCRAECGKRWQNK